MAILFAFVHRCASQPKCRLLPSGSSFAAWIDGRGHASTSGGIDKLTAMISRQGAAMMQRLTVRDVRAPLVVSAALTGFRFMTERSEATGKGPTEIPGVAELPNNAKKLWKGGKYDSE